MTLSGRFKRFRANKLHKYCFFFPNIKKILEDIGSFHNYKNLTDRFANNEKTIKKTMILKSIIWKQNFF